MQGYAIGAGFQLALACDLRVLADDARFTMREPALGLVPDLTGTKPLVELVGYSRALEICATARWVAADEARGSAWRPRRARDDLDKAVADLVAAVTARSRGRHARPRSCCGAAEHTSTSSGSPSAGPRSAGSASWRTAGGVTTRR